jgi:hypothetical protein
MHMNVTVSHEKLQAALNADGEFRFAARYWDGALQFGLGDDVLVLRLEGGEVVGVDTTSLEEGTKPGEVKVKGPLESWVQFLKPYPRPFYQDFYPLYMHHGFELGGDQDFLWAYYAALRRSGQVLRSVATVEEA